MFKFKTVWNAGRRGHQRGFTILETMIATVVLLAVSAIIMTGMIQLMQTQGTIANRTEMHTSVRSATELLQQEVGQAGAVSLPASPIYMTTAVNPPLPDTPFTTTVNLSSLPGVFNGEQLVVDTGLVKETITAVCGNPCANPITATFNYAHALPAGQPGVPVTVQGAFASGIVPPTGSIVGGGPLLNGSDGTNLKLYGDINGDGNMLYVEYICDWQNKLGLGPALYRNEMAFDAALKAPLDSSKIMLSSLDPAGNPNGTPCFTYQTQTVGPDTYVTDVQVTLTERTTLPDPTTHLYQNETKALLNVSPRNVFGAWELANAELTDRVQPMPPTVLGLTAQQNTVVQSGMTGQTGVIGIMAH